MFADIPTEIKPYKTHAWHAKHEENWTMSASAFKTYNTTRPKYESWIGSVQKRGGEELSK